MGCWCWVSPQWDPGLAGQDHCNGEDTEGWKPCRVCHFVNILCSYPKHPEPFREAQWDSFLSCLFPRRLRLFRVTSADVTEYFLLPRTDRGKAAKLCLIQVKPCLFLDALGRQCKGHWIILFPFPPKKVPEHFCLISCCCVTWTVLRI